MVETELLMSLLGGADVIGAVGAPSKEGVTENLEGLFRLRPAVDGAIVVHVGEVDRRQAFRDDGATSAESWAAERFGVSTPTSRAYTHVGEKAWEMPPRVES